MDTFSDAKKWHGGERFLEVLNGLASHAAPELRNLFSERSPVILTRAPGRLDLMGGIADYSGSLVLEMPIREAAFVATQRSQDPRIKVVTLDAVTGVARSFEIRSDELFVGRLSSYEKARAYFAQHPEQSWAGYVVGVLVAGIAEGGLRFEGGLSLLVWSEVPEGKGVSSSAALEVASLSGVLAALGEVVSPTSVARWCQNAENLVVGAPCGIMDQMTCALGKGGELLELLCQPAEVLGSVKIPAELSVWGIDSGVRHAVSGNDYGQVRTAAFMGQRLLGVKDHLANLDADEFSSQTAESLPASLLGATFLREQGKTYDPLTAIDPEQFYPVRAATAHPILEHARVRRFRSLLAQSSIDSATGRLLGELMFESHASYSACGLGSRNTDLLVELVREAGVESGLLGAKITGGGSGGTVAVLGWRGSDAAIVRVLQGYREKTGIASHLFEGSSPGAAEFGARVLGRG